MPNTQVATAIQAYLFFNGRCEEALDFYAHALGANVVMKMRFSEMPEQPQGENCPQIKEDWKNKIMHSHVQIGEASFLASDGCECDGSPFQNFSLALSVKDKATCERYFQALSEGGKVDMPLTPTFWSPMYGMLTDKFGVKWMLMVPGQ